MHIVNYVKHINNKYSESVVVTEIHFMAQAREW